MTSVHRRLIATNATPRDFPFLHNQLVRMQSIGWMTIYMIDAFVLRIKQSAGYLESYNKGG